MSVVSDALVTFLHVGKVTLENTSMIGLGVGDHFVCCFGSGCR